MDELEISFKNHGGFDLQFVNHCYHIQVVAFSTAEVNGLFSNSIRLYCHMPFQVYQNSEKRTVVLQFNQEMRVKISYNHGCNWIEKNAMICNR